MAEGNRGILFPQSKIFFSGTGFPKVCLVGGSDVRSSSSHRNVISAIDCFSCFACLASVKGSQSEVTSVLGTMLFALSPDAQKRPGRYNRVSLRIHCFLYSRLCLQRFRALPLYRHQSSALILRSDPFHSSDFIIAPDAAEEKHRSSAFFGNRVPEDSLHTNTKKAGSFPLLLR